MYGFYKSFFKTINLVLVFVNLSLSSCSNPKIVRLPNVDYKKAALLNVELGKHYLAQGYTERAKKKFLHALELMPNLPESHSGMAYFWEAVGEYREAEKQYKKSISLGNGHGSFYNQYALFLCMRNRYKEADQNFILAINDKCYTKTAEVYHNAGACALNNHQLSQAENYFVKALNHDPRRTQLILELAKINLDQGDLARAKTYLDNYYNYHKNNLTANYLWLSIKLADLLGEKNQVASQGLLLKNLFPNSEEYINYCKLYGNS